MDRAKSFSDVGTVKHMEIESVSFVNQTNEG